ncbi:MAG: LCP family protein [Coriobacteriia bacterium]|nr:LCP family protein [Coriobacteriia bacterium]
MSSERRAHRKARTGKRALIVLLSAIVFFLFAAIAAGALFYSSLHNRITATEIPQVLLENPAPPPTEPFNLLILGQDSREHGETGYFDTIILAHIDPIEQRVWMVSLLRHTRVEFPNYTIGRLNESYVHGGLNTLIQVVEELTDQKVDYFVAIDFWGFEDIIDAMGGIYVDVPIAINDPRADFTPDKRASQLDPGLQRLDGAHALTLVRHRTGYDNYGGEFGRMNTQQLFLKALLEQLGDIPLAHLPQVANSLADNVSTNFTPLELAQLGREMRRLNSDDLYAATLPGEWAFPFVWIDEEGAEEIWQNFGVRPFTFRSSESEE